MKESNLVCWGSVRYAVVAELVFAILYRVWNTTKPRRVISAISTNLLRLCATWKLGSFSYYKVIEQLVYV